MPLRLRLAAVVLLLAACGCSNQSTVLARVGQQTITADDFTAAAQANAPQYPFPPEMAKQKLLHDLVQRALLIEQARRLDLVPAGAIAEERRRIETPVLLEALLNQLAPRAVDVSDAEVAALWKRRAIESHVQVAFVADRHGADEAQAMLTHGSDLGAVADRFNLAGMLPPGGDVGWVTPGTMLDPLDGAIGTAPPGRVVGPLESPGEGWFFVKVLERRPHAEPPLAGEQSTLREMLRQRKQRTVFTRALARLREAYDVKVLPQGVSALFQRYNAPRDSMLQNAAGMPYAKPPTPAQAAQPVATWSDNGTPMTFTLGDAVRDLQDANTQKPNFMMAPLIEQWIQSRVMQRVALAEAGHRHLAEEPDVARRLRERTNGLLLDAIFAREIAGHVTAPDSEGVRLAWQRHAATLMRLDGANVAVTLTPDSAAAAAVASHTMHMGLAEAARAVTPPLTAQTMALRFPTSDRLWQNLEGMIMSMKPGEIRGPMHLPVGWMLVQLIRKDQGPQKFENLPPPMLQALQNEALDFAREERLERYTDSLRTVLHPEEHPERLRNVPWPTATELPATPGAGAPGPG